MFKFSWEMLFFESGDTEVFKADRNKLFASNEKDSKIILKCVICFTLTCRLCVPSIVEVSLEVFFGVAVVLCWSLTLYSRLKKMTNDSNLFSFIFLSTVFTLVISAISHLKEDKISFSEKMYFASKNPWILIHARKMAYNLHKLSYNFWHWNSLGLNELELQGNISKIKYSLFYGQDTQRLWLKKNKYRIN